MLCKTSLKYKFFHGIITLTKLYSVVASSNTSAGSSSSSSSTNPTIFIPNFTQFYVGETWQEQLFDVASCQCYLVWKCFIHNLWIKHLIASRAWSCIPILIKIQDYPISNINYRTWNKVPKLVPSIFKLQKYGQADLLAAVEKVEKLIDHEDLISIFHNQWS